MKKNRSKVSEFDNQRTKILGLFQNSSRVDMWKDPAEISKKTNLDENEIELVIKSTNDFVKNSKGKISTRNVYLKNEKITKRILDILDGRIK